MLYLLKEYMTRKTDLKTDLACMILCAGTSKRFGSDKMLANLSGKPVLAHAIEAVKSQVGVIAINGDDKYARFGLEIYRDEIKDKGPLSGILTAMQWAAGLGHDRVLTLAGDTIFLPADLACRLSKTDKQKIIVPKTKTTHQICCLWPVGLRHELRTRLLQNNLSVGEFIKSYPHEYVYFADDYNVFFNVNTKQDLQKAAQIINLL